jgi:hypothetical protein
MTLASLEVLAAGIWLALLSLALLVSQLALVPLQPQPQPFFAVSAAGAVSLPIAVSGDAMLMAAAFCGRTRPVGRVAVEPSAALPVTLMAWRRARLALRPPDAALCAWTSGALFEAADGDAVAEAAAAGVLIAAGAGFTRRADGLLTDAALAVPALPCSAIALRRFRASSRPERVALAVLSVACVITYLVTHRVCCCPGGRALGAATLISANINWSCFRLLPDAGRTRPASIRLA